MDNHVILLRLNQYWGNQTQYGQYTREQMYEGNPSWLDIRLEWFDKYLLENLKSQDDMNFWCFLLSDPETPLRYKNRIKEYEDILLLDQHIEIEKQISNNIRKLRFEAGEMSQQTLAERVGVTRQTIFAIEKDKYSPSLEVAFKISNVFQAPLEDVFTYE